MGNRAKAAGAGTTSAGSGTGEGGAEAADLGGGGLPGSGLVAGVSVFMSFTPA